MSTSSRWQTRHRSGLEMRGAALTAMVLSAFRSIWTRIRQRFLREPVANPLNSDTPIEELEENVRGRLREELRDYKSLVATAFNLVSELNRIASEDNDRLGPVARLQMVIFARLQGDLRVCEWAASTGYALQAMTMASAIHEVAYALIYLGDSDARAKEWIEHEKMHKQYPECGHRAVIDHAGKYFDLSDVKKRQEYSIYQQLCLAKHGNPLIQREYGVVETPEAMMVQQLPYYSARTLRFARFAIFHAVRAVGSAAWVFIRLHLSEKRQNELISYLVALGDEYKRIGERDDLYAVPDEPSSE